MTVIKTIEHEFTTDELLPGVDSLASWGGRIEQLSISGYTPELQFESVRELDIDLYDGSWLLEPADEKERRQRKGGRMYPVTGLTYGKYQPRGKSFVWQEPYLLIIDVSGLESVELEGMPSVYKDNDGYDLQVPSIFLEWRGYFGNNTLVGEGETDMEEPSADNGWFWRATIRLREGAKFLFVRPFRWLSRPEPTKHDPIFHERLAYYKQKFPDINNKYIDIGSQLRSLRYVKGETSEAYFREPLMKVPSPAIVIIHGLFSCCFPMLQCLDPLPLPTFRFEHDTFKEILTDADDLVEAIRTFLKPVPLVLIGHSRGGLVAREAARQLSKEMQVSVRTYGTPYLGSPLANASSRSFRALASMGRLAVNNIFSVDPLSYAIKLLFRYIEELPNGWKDLQAGSHLLKALDRGEDNYDFKTFAAKYDYDGLPWGAIFLDWAAQGIFDEKPNDGVVAVESALGAAIANPHIQRIELADSCSHTQYFSLAEIVEEIRNLSL